MKKMLRILQALLLSLFLTAGAFVPIMAENEDFDAFMEEEKILRLKRNETVEFL